MADGMYVNDVFVKGVFKNNIDIAEEEAKDNMDFIEKQLLSYIMASPELLKTEFEEMGIVGIINEVQSLLDEYQENTWRHWMIQIAKDFPEEVEYDY